jgi:hypothetical protein
MKRTKRNVRSGTELPPKARPSEERIRQRAHEIHKARGGGSGRELDDWLQAERELLAEQEHPGTPGEATRAIPFTRD